MSESVFLSYAADDRPRVEPLVRALEGEGLDVWWDRDIPRGQHFNRAIEAALDKASCAIVVWSRESVQSEWVFNEASAARRRRILVPVLLDDLEPPLEFRHLQAARLVGWSGDRNDTEWQSLLEAVRAFVSPPAAGAPGSRATRAAPTVLPLQSWWQTPAGIAAGAGTLFAGAALLVVALSSVGVIGPSRGSGTIPSATSANDRDTHNRPVTSPQDVASATQTAPAGEARIGTAGATPSATRVGDRVNLLDAEQGGLLLSASEAEWRRVTASEPGVATVSAKGFAVFSVGNGQRALIDAIGVFVQQTNGSNVAELSISAADQSETGPFTRVATVVIPNVRNMREPLHTIAVTPFAARYVRVEVARFQEEPNVAGYLGNLQFLGRIQR